MARQLASAWVSVSPTGFADFGRQAKSGIEKALKAVRAVVPIGADDKPAVTEIDKLKLKLDDLARKTTEVKIKPKDKEAVAALASLNVKLDRIGAKVSNPKITLEGTTRALADIAAVDLALDKLSKKQRGQGGSKGAGLLGSIGNLIPGLAGSSGSAGGGASGLAALAPAGGSLINPYTIIAGLAALPFAAQAAAGGLVTALGGGLAAVGIAGALAGSKEKASAQQVAAASSALSAAQLRVVAAQDRLNKLQSSGKATGAQLAAAQAAVASAQGSVATAQAKVNSLTSDATPLQEKMRASFSKLGADGKSSLQKIGAAFVPVLTSIATTADSVLKKLTPAFTGAEKTIAGPFKSFGDTLIKAFGDKNMQAAIQSVAKAFGGILNALTPQLPGDINAIADGIKRIADAVAKNPKAFADFISGIFHLAGYVLDAVAGLTTFATYIEQHFLPALGDMALIGLRAAQTVTDAFLSMVGTILHAAVDAFGWIPGIGSKLKTASKNFDNFKAGVDSNFKGMIDTTQAWLDQVNGAPGKLKDASGKIIDAFSKQGQAAKKAKQDVSTYTDAILANGVGSGKAKSARDQLLKDMTNAGVNASTAKKDVKDYTDAVSSNGVNSDKAKGARQRLNADIETAFKDSQRGKTDIGNLTTAIQQHGVKSDQARSARQRLIKDLENSGIDASTAKTLVNNLQTAITNMHGKTVPVGVHGSGSGGAKVTVQSVGGGAFAGKLVAISNRMAAGGYISGGVPGRDSVAAMLMPGEVVVPTAMVRGGAVDHLRGKLPGFAAGGLVSPMPDVFASRTEGTYGADSQGAYSSVFTAAFQAVANSVIKALTAQASQGGIGNYKPGAGVQQWRGVVRQALGLAGANVAQLTDPVLYQMQTESGGNPRAVNLWDSNAKAGHPSVGLMQVIRGTFQAFAGRFRGTGPFAYGVSENPLANVYSAIRYAQSAYGPGLRNAYGGIGSGHGYALGGLVADQGTVLAPGLNLRWNNTGRPEPLVPAGSGGNHYHLHVHNGGVIASQQETDRWLQQSLNRGARLGWLQQAVKRAGGG